MKRIGIVHIAALAFVLLLSLNAAAAPVYSFGGFARIENGLASSYNGTNWSSFRFSSVYNRIEPLFSFEDKDPAGLDLSGKLKLRFDTTFDTVNLFIDRASASMQTKDKTASMGLFYKEDLISSLWVPGFFDELSSDFERGLSIPMVLSGVTGKNEKPEDSGFGKTARTLFGVQFKIGNGIIQQQNFISGSTVDSSIKLEVRDRTSYSLGPVDLALDGLYRLRDFALPKVSTSQWASFKGTWYQFDTNSFCSFDGPDYDAKGLLSATFKALPYAAWVAGGIDQAQGGYQAKTIMKSVGNVSTQYSNVFSRWPYHNLLASAGGAFGIDGLFVSAGYYMKQGSAKYARFDSVTGKRIAASQDILTGEARGSVVAGNHVLKSSLEVWSHNALKGSDIVNFDAYGWGGAYTVSSCKSYLGVRSLSDLHLPFFSLDPLGIEFGKYNADPVGSQTLEAMVFAIVPLGMQFELNCAYRIKQYTFTPGSGSVRESYQNIYVAFVFHVEKSASIILAWGRDPRPDRDSEYGLPYELVRSVSGGEMSAGYRDILAAEKSATGLRTITMRGEFRF